jgi:hypothetical protein
MDDLQTRQRRLDRARALRQVELFIGFAVPLVAGFLYVASPGYSSGLNAEPPLIASLVPWAGVVGVLVGVVWMVRLSRPDPEAGERTWRYRDF